MSKEQLAVAEVGTSSFPSPTGIDILKQAEGTGITTPRLLIIEPINSPGDPYYRKYHKYYREHYKNIGGLVVPADIYKDIWPETLPKLGLLVLENVVNDPGYPQEEKDINGFFTFLKGAVAKEGIILIINSFRPGQSDLVFYQKIISWGESCGFRTIHNDIFWGIDFNNKGVGAVLKALENLGVLDPALKKGLEKHSEDFCDKWLILQRTI